MPFRIFGIKIPFKRKFSKHRKRKNYLYIKGVSLEYIYMFWTRAQYHFPRGPLYFNTKADPIYGQKSCT